MYFNHHFYKKVILSLFVSFILLLQCFSDNYKIVDVNYDIKSNGPNFFGKTNEYILENNVPVDKTIEFESLESLDEYILDYSIRLKNTRSFESVLVTKQIDESLNVILYVTLCDSFHLLALPYGKYDSNTGFIGKLKIKDTNFLGTLKTLSADINLTIQNDSETDSSNFGTGLTFDYDFPFKMGIFNAEWTNDYSLSYTFGNSSPEWDLNTGLKFSLPLDDFSFIFLFNQGFVHNFDYIEFDDEYYFSEDFKFSIPITIFKIENWSNIIYEPYIDFLINWDSNGINNINTDLSSPAITLGHTLKTSRVDWSNNYRNGINLSVSNNYKYNFQRNILYPSITSDFKFYKSFELFESNFLNRIGITNDIYTFFYLMDFHNPYFLVDGQKIGSRLRGIRDDQLYASLNANPCKVPAAICLNLDFPYRLFQTNFTSGIFKYLNFDLQISPFIDMALTYNKATEKWFSLKDGFYTAGIEVLVYPQKFSSFTIRASLGVDIGRKLFSNYIDMSWRKNISPYELFIGMGLHY